MSVLGSDLDLLSVFDLYLAMDLFSIPMGIISPFSKPKQEVNMLPRKGWRSVRGKICPIKQFIYSIQLRRHDDCHALASGGMGKKQPPGKKSVAVRTKLTSILQDRCIT
ncbi:unnamed protein product [Victoria cruziana]